jgi:hypothetical protein
MNWQEERYVRAFTRDTPDWVALEWQSRAVFWEILRKCDRRGTVDLGWSGIQGLSQLVRIPLDVVERGLAQLLDDGCVRQSGSLLIVKNFISAQEASASDAKRAREYRERVRDKLEELSAPGDAVSQPELPLDSDARHESSHDLEARDGPSHAVTLNCAVPSRTEPKEDPPLISPEGKAQIRGKRLPEDWVPSEATLRRFRQDGIDPLGSLERFRNHFLSAAGRTACKLDWERTFVNWVLEDIARARHTPWAPTPRATEPPTPAPDALSPAEAKEQIERLQQELHGLGAVPWEGAA